MMANLHTAPATDVLEFLALARGAELAAHHNAARIKLDRDLLETRARVEAGEESSGITWWQRFEKNFPQNRSTAQKAMQIAAAKNPQVADEAAGARNAIANRAYRARQSLPSSGGFCSKKEITRAIRRRCSHAPVVVAINEGRTNEQQITRSA